MKIAGQSRRSKAGVIAVSVIVALAVAILIVSLAQARRQPSTDDATIDAEVVHVAAAVGGRIIDLPVRENARVRKGDILFRIDPVPFEAAVAQAEADLALAKAQLGTQGRVVATQRSTASVAADQVHRASINQALAARTVERLRPLAEQGYAPRQQLDQAEVTLRDATTSLAQAREQQAATRAAIDTTAGAEAVISARQAAVTLARRALNDTVVRAPHDGRIVGLTTLAGELVVPSQALFTLIAQDEWHAVGNFREGALSHIAVGDCATVYSMIDRARPIRGQVDGIGWGVLDTDRVNLPRSAPFVEKSVNWVRVAQRFPVRVRLDAPADGLARLGASAVIEIRHGAACR
ncbi:MAG: multidrug transporter subunit MdtN [Caulobacter sp.]|nr:multidrug transporter subunit MdtN [Caulobacter sp.]